MKTICGYCGVGCQVEYALRDGKIIYAQSGPDAPVNGEFLCTKGRFGWDYVSHPERLTQPLIRRDLAYELGLARYSPGRCPESRRFGEEVRLEDSYIPVDWDTALDVVAGRLAEHRPEHGPDSLMGLASARCTNEDNYIFQKVHARGGRFKQHRSLRPSLTQLHGRRPRAGLWQRCHDQLDPRAA